MLYQPRRRPALPALAVLVLHLALGTLLMQQRDLPEPDAQRGELRLITLQLPRPQLPPPSKPRLNTPANAPMIPRASALPLPEFSSAPQGANAITLPAAAQPEAPASAPAPLNLALPKDWKPEQRNSPAQQAIHDPRANSPRRNAWQAMERRLSGEAEVIEMADGGKMVRRPDGSCTRTHVNRANALFPMDGPIGMASSGSCFNDKPGSAIQHARPR